MKQVRLEKWESIKDVNGDFKETVSKYNVWAEVTRQGGSRSMLNGQLSLQDTLNFKVRFKPAFKVTGNWKIVYDGRRHTVQSIEKDKEKRFWWNILADSKDTT